MGKATYTLQEVADLMKKYHKFKSANSRWSGTAERDKVEQDLTRLFNDIPEDLRELTGMDYHKDVEERVRFGNSDSY